MGNLHIIFNISQFIKKKKKNTIIKNLKFKFMILYF